MKLNRLLGEDKIFPELIKNEGKTLFIMLRNPIPRRQNKFNHYQITQRKVSEKNWHEQYV